MRFAHKQSSSPLESLGGANHDRRSSASRAQGHRRERCRVSRGRYRRGGRGQRRGKVDIRRCLCGLEKRCDDDISIDGAVVRPSQRKQLCYMVMQDVNHQLFAESVAEEVALSLRGSGLRCRQGGDSARCASGLDLSRS